jgi:isoquinoline 1-oxidoreductase
MGAMIQGLGGALFEAVDFADGKILNHRLSLYRVPRFEDVPKIDIVMLNREDLPSAGAGEAAIIGVAPAIRNAILDASGIGLTTLPLLPDSGFSIKI